MDTDLVAAFRSRGLQVITPLGASRTGKSDESQLRFATENACVFYTYNVADFYRLHCQWTAAGRDHAGMILAPQQRYSVGEQLRRVLRILASTGAAGMRNHVEFLTHWG